MCSTILAFVIAWRFIHSKYGRNLTSIRENEMAAEAVGINAYRYKRMSFTFSAIYAGWAGALYAGYLMYIVPVSFNLAKSCELITTTVIGGLGSLTGSVLGSFTALRSFSSSCLSPADFTATRSSPSRG